MKHITLIAIFDDLIFIYRDRKFRKYYTNWQRSARVRRAIGNWHEYKQLSQTWCETYRIDRKNRY